MRYQYKLIYFESKLEKELRDGWEVLEVTYFPGSKQISSWILRRQLMKYFVIYRDHPDDPTAMAVSGFGTEGEAKYFIRKRMTEGPFPNNDPTKYRVIHGIEREVSATRANIQVELGKILP